MWSGSRHAELLEEDVGHLAVVVLPGVDDDVAARRQPRGGARAMTGAIFTKFGRAPTTYRIVRAMRVTGRGTPEPRARASARGIARGQPGFRHAGAARASARRGRVHEAALAEALRREHVGCEIAERAAEERLSGVTKPSLSVRSRTLWGSRSSSARRRSPSSGCARSAARRRVRTAARRGGSRGTARAPRSSAPSSCGPRRAAAPAGRAR